MLEKAKDAPFDIEFAERVKEGLSRPAKSLPSRYFYDAEGDRLFQAIMRCPEYYLTDCEFEVFRTHGGNIAECLGRGDGPLELVELGSGDGLKTCLLLDALNDPGMAEPWSYRPVDISENSLDLLRERITPGRPWLDYQPIHGNYHDVVPTLSKTNGRRVFMFLGSNMGNYTPVQTETFLAMLASALNPGDALLIGLDLKKDPAVIRAAYNDSAGYTRDFNLNLLTRMNRELGADFDLPQFAHAPTYDPESGAAESHLESLVNQRVRFSRMGFEVQFRKGERIHTEISRKYDEAMITDMSRAAGFEVEAAFFDQRKYFTDQVWRFQGNDV